MDLLSYRVISLINLGISGNIPDISDWLMVKVNESKISNLYDLISIKQINH